MMSSFVLDDEFIDSILKKYGKHLSKINLSNNGLNCIKNIERFTKLEVLNLSRNDLKDISPISRLVCIKSLDLSENLM